MSADTMERAVKKGAPSLSWKDFPKKGYIPKKARDDFLKTHSGDIVLESKDGRYTMGLVAIPFDVKKVVQA